MLDTALKYTEELKKLHINTWYNDKYKYYNYRSFWETPKFEESTWDGHDFVSLNKKGEIIGAIGYSINRPTESVCGLGIINFTDDPTFGKDVLQAIKDIFEKFNFRKLSFCVVIGNPIEKTYDRLSSKYGGRIIGIEKAETKLADNKYYDVKRYEILREDYMKAKKPSAPELETITAFYDGLSVTLPIDDPDHLWNKDIYNGKYEVIDKAIDEIKLLETIADTFMYPDDAYDGFRKEICAHCLSKKECLQSQTDIVRCPFFGNYYENYKENTK